MASSLEELLAEEGFRGRRSGARPRPSFQAEAVSMPLYPFQGQQMTELSSGPSGHRIKTERTRPDVSWNILRGELPRSNSSSSMRPRDNLVTRGKIDGGSKKENWERRCRGLNNVQEDRTLDVGFLEDIKGSEIVEVDAEEDERVKYIYSDKVYNSERSEKSSKGNGEKERHRDGKGKDIKVDKRHSGISNKNLYMGYGDNDRKNMKQSEASYESSVRGSVSAKNYANDRRPKSEHIYENKTSMKQPEASYESSVRRSVNGKSVEDNRRRKSKNIAQAVSELALDEVAVQAMVSILNGYSKRFLKDEEFRTTLRHNCLVSLNFADMEGGHSIESKVKTNLEQAIDIVEKAAEEATSAKDLKKASLLLNVIKGLDSNDLKDGYTSGSPNSSLSSCAHLYLSVIYKLQKKDRVSAKHLLQVFCNSPFLARTLFLPELWDDLFFPHLSHLKIWYNQEADSLLNTPSKIRKLKLLDKVYNEILDSGTYQFAVYYKDWLTEGVEAPSVPSIHIPSMSVQGVQPGGLQNHSVTGSPSTPFSPQPMVSKKLYDAMFDRSRKPGFYEAEHNGEADSFDIGASSSDSPAIEVKQALTFSSERVKYLDQDKDKQSSNYTEDNAFLLGHGHLSASKEERKLVKVNASQEKDLNVENSDIWHEKAGDTHMLNASSHTKANELILKSLAKSVFELQQIEDSGALNVSSLSHSNEPVRVTATHEGAELYGSCEYFDEGSFFASIPQDFICPLTGQLFEDPVTLETGQTFEREAITEWFNQEKKTCPVTGKTLESPTVPLTNFILKRVIDGWKLEHCSRLLAFASQIVRNSRGYESKQRNETAIFVLEKLLTTFSREERLTNAKHLLSLGGLEFLIKRFEFGNLEEKTRVAALLSCCIEADEGCRNQIARKIDRQCLFQLLHSKQSKSRRNALFLLIELVCLSRRKDVMLFLSGLQDDEIVKTMHILLGYIQSSPPEQRPLVAVLLLHLELLVEPRKYSVYREEAVDAIVVALESSLTDKKVQEKSCRALFILGGRFSASGKLMTESWVLEQAGFKCNCEVNSHKDNLLLDDSVSLEDEEEASEEWLRNLSASLLRNGKKSFLETMSKCLGSGNSDLVRVCLTTIAWLSCVLSSLSDAEFQLSAFSSLIPGLKESLENGEKIEHRVLASMSLLNFCKIPECRVLLLTIAEEITVALQSLAEVTWTAKQLYDIISRDL